MRFPPRIHRPPRARAARAACAALAVATLAAAPPARAQESAFDELDAPAQGQVPIVTPTHLRQAVRDIPATVTIIDAETIATFGILTIPNALRMIEGTPPQRLSWVNYDLKSAHKTSFGPDRITVLIDGIEVDSSHFAESVDWQALPVSIDDVERIEVTRGPSNAGIGHALTTVLVNVVTKHPADVERAFVRATLGTFNTNAIFGRAGFSAGPMAIRLTLTHNARDPMDDQGLGTLRTAHQSIDRFNLRTSTRVDPQTTLAIDAAVLDGTISGEPTNTASSDIVKHTGYAAGVWTRSLTPDNDVKLRLEQWWDLQNTSVPGCTSSRTGASAGTDATTADAAPANGAAPAATAPLALPLDPLRSKDTTDCALSDDDEHRTLLEVQDVQVFSSALRAVGGVGLRQEEARTSIPQAARWTASFTRVFGGIDWQPSPDWTINAGASADHDASDEYDTSLRAGVNWHLSEVQTVRAAWSLGDWASQAYKTLDVADNVVTQERMNSADLGYLLKVPERNVSLDARLFWMRASGQIWANKLSQKAGELPAHGEIWGLETRGTADLTSGISGFLGLAYGEEGDTSGISARGTRIFWSGAAGVYANLPAQWRAAVSFSKNSAVSPSPDPALATATLLKDFRWLETRIRASLTYRHASSVPSQVDGVPVSVSQHSVYATVEAAF
jgi:iron complex outermembrane receptor protein